MYTERIKSTVYGTRQRKMDWSDHYSKENLVFGFRSAATTTKNASNTVLVHTLKRSASQLAINKLKIL